MDGRTDRQTDTTLWLRRPSIYADVRKIKQTKRFCRFVVVYPYLVWNVTEVESHFYFVDFL